MGPPGSEVEALTFQPGHFLQNIKKGNCCIKK
jgi:hypothetical protein